MILTFHLWVRTGTPFFFWSWGAAWFITSLYTTLVRFDEHEDELHFPQTQTETYNQEYHHTVLEHNDYHNKYGTFKEPTPEPTV